MEASPSNAKHDMARNEVDSLVENVDRLYAIGVTRSVLLLGRNDQSLRTGENADIHEKIRASHATSRSMEKPYRNGAHWRECMNGCEVPLQVPPVTASIVHEAHERAGVTVCKIRHET